MLYVSQVLTGLGKDYFLDPADCRHIGRYFLPVTALAADKLSVLHEHVVYTAYVTIN